MRASFLSLIILLIPSLKSCSDTVPLLFCKIAYIEYFIEKIEQPISKRSVSESLKA